MAAVEKIEDQRKPEDFFGHRNRTAGFVVDEVQGGCQGAAGVDLLTDDVAALGDMLLPEQERPRPFLLLWLIARILK